MRIYHLIEANLSNLQADDTITVYHASSDLKDIMAFVTNGVDGKQPIKRKYPHYVSNSSGERELINRGLFVTTNLKTAMTFGKYAIKFKTSAKNLFSPFPDKQSVKRDVDEYIEYFKNSFRPELSAYLSGKAWSNEPQALFRGLTSPRAIEAVYVGGERYSEWEKLSSSEFVEKYANDTESVSKYLVEPQEANTITVDEIIQRRVDKFGGKIPMTPEKVRDVLAKNLDKEESFEGQLAFFNRTLKLPYSAGKRLIMQALKDFGVNKKPSISEKDIYRGM